MKSYLDVDWLKANHTMIHYFGLGFIQVKIDQLTRMHFYVLGLEPIVPEEDVHNHRYDFESMIVRGELVQELYSVDRYVSIGTHEMSEVSCEEGASPQIVPGTFKPSLSSRHKYLEGSSYYITHDQFHRVVPGVGGCITLVKRSDYRKSFAHVIRPLGGPSVCPFSRKIPEDELWRLVSQTLEEM